MTLLQSENLGRGLAERPCSHRLVGMSGQQFCFDLTWGPIILIAGKLSSNLEQGLVE